MLCTSTIHSILLILRYSALSKAAEQSSGIASPKILTSSALYPLDPFASTVNRQEATRKLKQG